MRLAATCLAVTLVVLVVACGGTEVTPTTPAENTVTPIPEAEQSKPTKIPLRAAATPTLTPTAEPLSESEQLDEDEFLASAPTFIDIRGSGQYGSIAYQKSATKGLFQVAIVRVGPFKITGQESGEEEYFRIDLKIDNVGDEEGLFEPDALVLLDGQGTRYEHEPDASIHAINGGGAFSPEHTERGFLLFQPVAPETASIKLSFELGQDENASPHQFEYELDLSRVEWN